jgi:hypothetical protein
MGTSKRTVSVLAIVVVLGGVGFADWADSFTDGKPDLTTWQFLSFPQITGTFTQSYPAGADGNTYLAMREVTPKALGGAMFGAGFPSAEEFTDVRVGGTVNVTGDAAHNHHGFAARAFYFVDPDGKLSGIAPGIVASCYVMHVNWQDGPANLMIDVEKVVQLENIQRIDFDVVIPGLANERSYYAELDVLGSGPVYVTGSLYESKGGALVARTPTMVDTAGNDPWEEPDVMDAPFLKGPSGIFAQNEQLQEWDKPGFYTTFDDVFSTSDGPAAAGPVPADGATGVSALADLSWVEAKFATSRQLWFGLENDVKLISPVPTGKTYDPGLLRPNQTYQWRVDEVGPSGTVQGPAWQFTTGDCITIDDFESYATDAEIAAAWPHNIAGYDYIFLETSTIQQGAKAMKFTYQNGAEPFVTETTRTFAAAQDWTVGSPDELSLQFRGMKDNFAQPLYVRVEGADGNAVTVTQPFDYAVQSEPWRSWDISLADFAGVNLAAVKKLVIGTGSGTDSGQPSGDVDTLYIDNICLTGLASSTAPHTR